MIATAVVVVAVGLAAAGIWQYTYGQGSSYENPSTAGPGQAKRGDNERQQSFEMRSRDETSFNVVWAKVARAFSECLCELEKGVPFERAILLILGLFQETKPLKSKFGTSTSWANDVIGKRDCINRFIKDVTRCYRSWEKIMKMFKTTYTSAWAVCNNLIIGAFNEFAQVSMLCLSLLGEELKAVGVNPNICFGLVNVNIEQLNITIVQPGDSSSAGAPPTTKIS